MFSSPSSDVFDDMDGMQTVHRWRQSTPSQSKKRESRNNNTGRREETSKDLDAAELEEYGRNEGIRAARNLLITSDILERVGEVKSEMQKQRNAVQSQLRSISNSSLEEAKLSLEILEQSRDNIGIIQTRFSNIDELCRESQKLVRNYELIKQLYTTYRNIKEARDGLDRILKLKEHAELLNDQLEDEQNLADVHLELQEFDTIKETVQLKAENETDKEIVFGKYIEIVEHLSSNFLHQLQSAFHHAFETVQSEPEAVVRAVRVVVREEQKDQQLLRAGNENVKRYKQRMFQWLGEAVDRRFDELLSESSGELEETLMILDELLNDLDIVTEAMLPCFPPEFRIYDFYKTKYAEKISQKINEYVDTAEELANADRMKLLKWLASVNNEIMLETNIDFGSAADKLESNYISDTGTMMAEWTGRMIEEDLKEEQPWKQSSSHNKLYTLVPVEFFQMIDQHLLVTKETGRLRLVRCIIESAKATIKYFQDQILNKLNQKIFEHPKTYVKEHSESPAPDLDDLPETADLATALKSDTESVILKTLCAHLNNMSKSEKFLDELQTQIRLIITDLDLTDDEILFLIDGNEEAESASSSAEGSPTNTSLPAGDMFDEDEDELQNMFEDSRIGFSKTGKKIAKMLAQCLYSWIEEPMGMMFTSEWLSGSPPMETVKDTLEDFFVNDISVYVEEFWLPIICKELVSLITTEYIRRLSEPGTFLKRKIGIDENAIERISQDYNLLESFFCPKYIRIKRIFDKVAVPMRMANEILMVENEDGLFLTISRLQKEYKKADLSLVQSLLEMRTDLSKSDKSSLIKTAKEYFNDSDKRKALAVPSSAVNQNEGKHTSTKFLSGWGIGKRKRKKSEDDSPKQEEEQHPFDQPASSGDKQYIEEDQEDQPQIISLNELLGDQAK
eukprot:gb/GECH01008999.1/.p1 GENE.gb/GECH01008999.1/~~gb/GECH01008999.1/.p1  ORF type:complete len:907 (+),score=231.97 gb/GECH01008999.1/:1-2721(+)